MGQLTKYNLTEMEVALKSYQSNENTYNGLTNIDKKIYLASLQKKIKYYQDNEVLTLWSKVCFNGAILLGINIKDKNLFAEQVCLMCNLVKDLFGEYTFTEIGLAFQLTASTLIDKYFNLDSNNAPDKKHYNNLSLEYISRILKAYTKRKKDIINIVIENNKEVEQVSEDKKAYYIKLHKQHLKGCFIKYKYTNKLEFIGCSYFSVFEWLSETNYISYYKITETDKKKAYAQFMNDFYKGLKNKYVAERVKIKGLESEELTQYTNQICYIKSIKNTFDKIIKEEIQINSLINL